MQSFVVRWLLAGLVMAATSSGNDLAAEETASQQFSKLLEEQWAYRLREDPLFATAVGDHTHDDLLPSISLADCVRRHGEDEKFLQRFEAINRTKLSPTEQINYDVFGRQLRDDAAEYRFGSHLIPISNREGFHISFPELRREMPLFSVKDYEHYIARLRGFDAYAAGQIELLREGIKQEKTLPAVIMQKWQGTVDPHIVDDPTRSLLYEPLVKFPAAIPVGEHERLRTAAKAAILQGVVPGYVRFRDFLRDEYVPHCRDSISASALPDGRDFYRQRVKRFTTLDVTPDEVHQRGLSEVARIRAEMEEVIRGSGFQGDFAAYVQHLRDEPSYYATSPEQLMKEASLILKKMDGQLPVLFGKLPRMSYGLRPVPDYVAPRTTSAYYQPPSGDGTRAGFFFLNTYNLKGRPLYALESLALHEAVPGHHLQLALQQELTDVPQFRRFSDCTAFIEGWALYAERLGLEAGFYEKPESNFGRLSMEMWRACRLVVDTGIHYFDWPRDKAIAFMQANSAESLHNIEAEVDRYIGWPGQALAYKTGELKIRELRVRAEQKLGAKFDLRAFHDAVLSGGAVPLDVLEGRMEEWIGGRIAK